MYGLILHPIYGTLGYHCIAHRTINCSSTVASLIGSFAVLIKYKEMTVFAMNLLACSIARTYPRVKQSHIPFCVMNIGRRENGNLSTIKMSLQVSLFKSSSVAAYFPGWRNNCILTFGKHFLSTKASSSDVNLPEKLPPSISHHLQKTNSLFSTDIAAERDEMDDVLPLSPLEEISEDEAMQIVAEPLLPPASFTLCDYVDRSETLSKLVLLGVNLSKLERRHNVATFLLKLDFEKDIQKILLFLKDVGVEDWQLGPFITINPFILTQDLEVLQKRVAYLVVKKFSKEAVARMVSRAPYLLNFSVERLDNRLGFFQKELKISPQKTRDLVIRYPRMLTGSLEPIKENLKVCQIEMGFRENEIQHMITHVPKILTGNKRRLTELFDFVHNHMAIPHHCIAKFPQVFNTRVLKVKERHMFLAFLGRAQYDPAKPNYVSLDKFVSLPDEAFCVDVAKASVQDFEKFLKTL